MAIHFDFIVDDFDAENIFDCISQEIARLKNDALEAEIRGGEGGIVVAYRSSAEYLETLKSKMTNQNVTGNKSKPLAADDEVLNPKSGYMEAFKNRSKKDKINILASVIYRITIVEPYGYPNGLSFWDELPDVDVDIKLGLDKLRFIDAASRVYDMLIHEPTS